MRFLATLFLLSLFILPAQAGWQSTEWGMTPEEVIKASDGAFSGEITDRARTLKGSYEAFYISFKSEAVFDENKKLIQLNLYSDDVSDCPHVLTSLAWTYGDMITIQGEGQKINIWRDTTNKNLVTFTQVYKEGSEEPLRCDILYRELPIPNAKGGL